VRSSGITSTQKIPVAVAVSNVMTKTIDTIAVDENIDARPSRRRAAGRGPRIPA